MWSAEIKAKARELGFSLCRILPVQRAPHGEFFSAWLRRGNAADMHYLARQLEGRLEPGLLTGDGGSTFHSLIVLGTDYFQGALDPAIAGDPSRGLIAAFAWGGDYHEIIKPRLYDLDAYVRTLSGRTTFGRCFVDTGPVLERDWAQRAGLGFAGKNCCVINPSLGSWLFLSTMLVPERLEPDAPTDSASDAAGADRAWTPQEILDGAPARAHFGAWTVADDAGIEAASADRASSDEASPDEASTDAIRPEEAAESAGTISAGAVSAGVASAGVVSTGTVSAGAASTGTCGRCDRCLIACPTGAFVGPFHLDARRCISYWTIETQAAIPRELRARFGNRIFGCDICQEVCPWNRGRPPLPIEAIARRVAPPLLEGFAPDTPYWLDEEAFHARFRRTPVTRAKRAGMLRNVCVALGNWGSPDAIDALRLALRDASPIARGHAAWALGRIAAPTARTLLTEALRAESDPGAHLEMTQALAAAGAA